MSPRAQLVTSAKEIMLSSALVSLFVCLLVNRITQKKQQPIFHKIQWNVREHTVHGRNY